MNNTEVAPRRALMCPCTGWPLGEHPVVSAIPAKQPRRGYIEGREDYDMAPVGTGVLGRWPGGRLILIKHDDGKWYWHRPGIVPEPINPLILCAKREVARWGGGVDL